MFIASYLERVQNAYTITAVIRDNSGDYRVWGRGGAVAQTQSVIEDIKQAGVIRVGLSIFSPLGDVR